MLKLLKKYLIEGVAWGCVVIVIQLTLNNLNNPEVFYYFVQGTENLLIRFLGHILIVMGFVSTMIVFEFPRLRFGVKLLIHLTLALSILTFVGFSINIYSMDNLTAFRNNLFENLLVVFAIWIYHYFKEKRDIERINKQLLERSFEQQSDTE